jgi:hypothetical protein
MQQLRSILRIFRQGQKSTLRRALRAIRRLEASFRVSPMGAFAHDKEAEDENDDENDWGSGGGRVLSDQSDRSIRSALLQHA